MPAAPIHHTPIDSTGAWDGPAAVKAFDKAAGDFVKFFAWVDEGATDPKADGTDKEDGWGPHHDVSAAGVPGDANLAGVHAAVAALNGARTATSRVPDADRQGVFDHLKAHLVDAGVKAEDLPELKAGPGPAESRRAPATAAERRAAALSFGGVESAVYEALLGAYGSGTDGWFDCWIQDLGTDWVVFQSYEDPPGTGLWQLGYILDGSGAVTLGADPVKVTTVTTFVPVAAPETKASTVPAETRAAASKDCPTCDGTGKILDGNRDCPDCDGTGAVPAGAEAASETKTARKPRHRRDLPVMPEFRRYRIDRSAIELRSVATEDGTTITELTGIPIVYDTPYTVTDMWGDFEETMHAGVCSQALASGEDVRFLLNHDGPPMARTTSGTLTVGDSPVGVTIAARLDTRQSLANDLVIAIERGDVSQMSVGFQVSADTWSNDLLSRDIYQIRPFDFSAVTYPASPTTSIDLAQRSMWAAPVESRARIRKMWQVGKEIREGRALSRADSELLMSGMEALHSADEVGIPDLSVIPAPPADEPAPAPPAAEPASETASEEAVAVAAAGASRARQLELELLQLRHVHRDRQLAAVA